MRMSTLKKVSPNKQKVAVQSRESCTATTTTMHTSVETFQR